MGISIDITRPNEADRQFVHICICWSCYVNCYIYRWFSKF